MKILIKKDENVIHMYDENDEEKSRILLHNGIIWEMKGNEEIILTRDIEPSLFDNLWDLLNNNYMFVKSSGNQSSDRLEFNSDEMHLIDKNDSEKMKAISRLIIERDPSLNTIKIKMDNPYSDENPEVRRVFFMEGQQNIMNTESEQSLEIDMIEALNDVLKKEHSTQKRSA